MPQDRIPLKSYYYRPQGRKQLEDRRNIGESSCNFGDGTDQRVQSLMFIMMMMMMMMMMFTAEVTAHDQYCGHQLLRTKEPYH